MSLSNMMRVLHARRRFGLRLLFGSFSALLCAASLAVPVGTLRFEQLSVDSGLPQASVTSILQDRDGFMWFGGQAGLSRYDGYSFVVYKNDPADQHSLSDNSVQALHQDKQGELWIGTRSGLQRYNRASENFTHYLSHELSDLAGDYLDIRTIANDGHGVLWLTTRTGLIRFDSVTGRATVMRHDAADSNSLCNDDVNAFAFDRLGSLWVGTAAGIDRLIRGSTRFEHFRVDDAKLPDFKRNAVQALWVDRAHTLWIGTQSGLETWQIGQSTPEKKRRFGVAEGLNPGAITVLYEDREGTMWVGTNADGLKRWDATVGKFVTYRQQPAIPHSLADNKVSSLFQDRTGILWVGTWFGGASRVDLATGGFAHFMAAPDQPLSLSSSKVNGIIGDGKDGLWLATFGGGLNRVDLKNNRVTVFRHNAKDPHSLSDNQVTSIARDKRRDLWVGTRTGLNRFDPSTGRFTVRPFRTGDPLSDFIHAIVPDRTGVLWVASRGGLHRLDPTTNAVQTFRHDPADAASLADNFVWTILEDRRGRLWVATSNGLDLFDRSTGRFSHSRHDPKNPASLSHNRVSYLLEDRHGTLWVGTGGGLNRLNADAANTIRFRSYMVKDGIANPAIDGILEDDTHHLWISTDGGISRFNPATDKFRNFFTRDGIAPGDYFVGSAYRAPDGTMYFGSFNGGLTAFKPETVYGNRQPPQVAITDFQILNQSVRSGQVPEGFTLDAPIQNATEATLSYRHAMFSLEFAALHYADPKSNRYAYQLHGFDKDWVYTDASKRFATYTNLDPGSYVFRVKAANKDGVWNEVGATLEITVTPPFWKTWWFRALIAALSLIGISAVFRIRVRSLVRQKAVLEQQVMERTAEIIQQKEVVEREKAEAEHQKSNVEMAHRNISLLSDIGREITAMLDREAIMTTVYRRVHALMDAEVFGVGIYRDELAVIEFPFVMEQEQRGLPYVRSMADPDQLAVWCVNRRAEVFINDLYVDHQKYIDSSGLAKLAVGIPEDGAAPPQPLSMLYAPMAVMGRILGVLTVQSLRKNAYQHVHMDMLATLASYTAVALDNADAYQQLGQAMKELKNTQQQLVFQEKMASVGTLTAGIAHEINNPANFAHAGAQTLGMDLERFRRFLVELAGEEASAEVLARLNQDINGLVGQVGIIVEGTSRIRDLVKDLRTFSRLGEAEKKAVRIADSLLSTINLVRTQYALAAEIRCDLAANPELECWPAQLNQVFMNLIVNACHAIQEKQQKTGDVNRGILNIRSRIDQDYLLIEFEDNGCGIPRIMIDRIFEPFFTTKAEGKGTGLGLSISFGIIGKHMGNIEARSVEGEGSCFTVRLPLAKAAPGMRDM